jgi:hypothetical protein
MSDNEVSEKAFAAFVTIILAVLLLALGSQLLNFVPVSMPGRAPIEIYYWTFRGFDILIQAFLILAAAAAIAAFFRSDPSAPPKEETILEEERKR